jgi:hypothetical protein
MTLKDQEIRQNWINRDEDEENTKPWDTIISPSQGWVPLNLGEVRAYHELLYFLVWRNIKIRYKQTVLGGIQYFLWAVGRDSLGWRSLPDLCIHSACALDLFCECAFASQ